MTESLSVRGQNWQMSQVLHKASLLPPIDINQEEGAQGLPQAYKEAISVEVGVFGNPGF